MYDNVLTIFLHSLLELTIQLNNKLRKREAKKRNEKRGIRSKKYHE